jgi:hypothetical protein
VPDLHHIRNKRLWIFLSCSLAIILSAGSLFAIRGTASTGRTSHTTSPLVGVFPEPPTPPVSPSVAPTRPAPPDTTATTLPIAPPPATSWPTSANTGASGTLTAVTGDIILSTPGMVYANKRVNGTIAVTACNVTLKNVEVDAGIPYTGDSTPDLFAIWLQNPATCSVTLDHVSVLTKSAPNVYLTTGIRVAYGAPMTITHSKILGAQLGMVIGPGVVTENYVLLGATLRGDHNEDILEDGVDGLAIIHNTFLNPNGQTSALSLFTEFGHNAHLLVENNLLAGGGYTVYAGDGKSDNQGNPARAVDVSFIDNVFWRTYFPTVGNFGPGRAYNPAGGGQWTNNRYMNADGTLTSELVPQPPIDQ